MTEAPHGKYGENIETPFPQQNALTIPVERFWFEGQWLNLYLVKAATERAPYALFWQNQNYSSTQGMTAQEVIAVLAGLINKGADL